MNVIVDVFSRSGKRKIGSCELNEYPTGYVFVQNIERRNDRVNGIPFKVGYSGTSENYHTNLRAHFNAHADYLPNFTAVTK